ncbi:MAG: L,D-transpeptidase [Pseudolabrys sp.]|nr:L,D-transpeptidase [Pseudolabrys sp.]MDP2294100.1 L,D-transpeptidase [Pseudolabrys sp.]
MSKPISTVSIAALIAAAALSCGTAQAQTYGQQYQPQYQMQEVTPDEGAQMDPRLQRQIVSYQTREAPGTIIVDTPNTYLYFVLGNGQAIRYGIGVGREGFTWAGVKTVAKKAEWPDWYPPAEMIARQPYLPRMTMGGPGNPLGARALYLGTSEYRIHGTNDPTTIGQNVSSGCIRLTNEDVTDLYERVQVGAKVIVLPQTTEARVPAQRQQTVQQVSMTSSYAAEPAPRRQIVSTWASIRPANLY